MTKFAKLSAKWLHILLCKTSEIQSHQQSQKPTVSQFLLHEILPQHACPFDKNTARTTEFPCCSPSVWNALPSQLRSSSIRHGQFRAGLKIISSHSPTDTSENICRRAYHFTFTFYMKRYGKCLLTNSKGSHRNNLLHDVLGLFENISVYSN